jgi:hypothetical protein
MLRLILSLAFGISLGIAKQAMAQSATLEMSKFTSQTMYATTINGPTVSVSSTFASTIGNIQAKSVAEREALKDEFPSLVEDMNAGLVKSINDVEQLALRETFKEIAADKKQMQEINGLNVQGSALEKMVMIVGHILFN